MLLSMESSQQHYELYDAQPDKAGWVPEIA